MIVELRLKQKSNDAINFYTRTGKRIKIYTYVYISDFIYMEKIEAKIKNGKKFVQNRFEIYNRLFEEHL